MYVTPFTSVLAHDDGNEYTADPATAAVAAAAPVHAAALATGR
jgi:hypothetical protein